MTGEELQNAPFHARQNHRIFVTIFASNLPFSAYGNGDSLP
jgi:hypothetical protein